MLTSFIFFGHLMTMQVKKHHIGEGVLKEVRMQEGLLSNLKTNTTL